MKKVYNNSGAFSWYFQRITGVLIIIFLIIHLYVMHLSGSPNIVWSWDAFLSRFQASPWMKVFYFMFLTTVLFHGLNGTWQVAGDYINSRSLKALTHATLIIVGVFFFIIGSLSILYFNNPTKVNSKKTEVAANTNKANDCDESKDAACGKNAINYDKQGGK